MPQPVVFYVATIGVLVGCVRGRPPTEVARVIDGERRVGPFVSPYAYEHFIRAEIAAAQGDDERAVQEYRMARAGPADDAYVASRLAEAYQRLGRAEDADRSLQEAEALDADSPSLWMARATVAEARGERRLAVSALVRAQELDWSNDAPTLRLARLLESSGDAAAAAAALERFADAPLRRAPRVLRARLALAISRGDGSTALSTVEDLMRVSPVSAHELEATARAALPTHPVMAESLMAQLAQSQPRAGYRALWVEALVASGQLERATEVLRTEPPESFGGVLEHARLWLRAGGHEEAAALASEAVALERPGAHETLARAQLRSGHWAEAASELFEVAPQSHESEAAEELIPQLLRWGGVPALAAEVAAP